MWSDFDTSLQDTFKVTQTRGLCCGKQITQIILDEHSSKTSKLCGIFRAHQHQDRLGSHVDIMHGLVNSKGVYKLWKTDAQGKIKYETDQQRSLEDGIVLTLNVGPDSIYGKGCGFTFGVYVEMTIGSTLQDCKLSVNNIDVTTPDQMAQQYEMLNKKRNERKKKE